MNSISLMKSKTIMVDQPDLDVPILPKRQELKQMFCKAHSRDYKKYKITHFDLGSLGKKKPESLKRLFLCQKCCQQIKLQNQKHKEKTQIMSTNQFYQNIIKKPLLKYKNQKTQQQRQLNNRLLKQAKQKIHLLSNQFKLQLNTHVDKLNQCIGTIFQTLQHPFDSESVRLFKQNNYNEKMIQKFVMNSKIVQKYEVLIGNNSKIACQNANEGMKGFFDQIQQKFKRELYQMQRAFKLYLKKFQNQEPMDQEKSKSHQRQNETQKNNPNKLIQQQKQQVFQKNQKQHKLTQGNQRKVQKMIPQNQKQKINRQINNRRRQEDIREQRHRKIARNDQRRRRQASSSSQSSQSSSDSESSSSQQSSQSQNRSRRQQHRNNRKDNSNRRQKHKLSHKFQKTKLIIKQKRPQKPYRIQNIVIVGEQYQKQTAKQYIRYIIQKAKDTIKGRSSIHELQKKQFLKKYGKAYDDHVNNKPGRNKQMAKK